MTTTALEPVGEVAVHPDSFLTADDVASTLGIAKTSVYDRLSRGDLAYHRIGRLVRIRRNDLDAFITRTRVEVRPPNRYGRPPQA